MKANEAPEKLYIDLFKGEFNVSHSPINNSVEYTRTDAFIDKAVEWIEHNFGKYDSDISFEKEMFIEEFIKAMKV